MTVTVLRPNATINQTGIDTTTATAPHLVLSDDADATYARGIAPNGTTRVHLGTTTLGALRCRRVRIRVRNAHDVAGAGLQTGQVFLYDTTGPGRAAALNMSRGTTAVAEQAGQWDSAGPDGQPWSQALITRMAVQVIFGGDSAWMRLHEVYVDVDTNAQPVVSAVTVTGITTTTRPSVGWTFTDADGDPQTRFRVKVFSAAQYGAAGFTPDGSTPAWDSGDRYGSDDTVTGTADLVNGTTYKAYVVAAQDWPGPEGQLWWSAWVASSAFTMAVIPPPTPALTVATDPALPGYRVLAAVVAPVNLLSAQQASFEDTTTTGWTALGNCSISNSAVFAVDGTRSLQMSSTAAGTMTAETSLRYLVPPSTSISATGTVRAAASARATRVGLRFYDAAGALIGATSYGPPVTDATGSNVTPTVTATSPANAYTAAVVLEVQATAAAAELHRWDRIGMQVGTSAAWSTGGAQGTATVLLERCLKVDGGRGDAKNWAHAQLASGSGLTRGVDGFYARQPSLLRSAPLEGPHPAGTAHAGARMVVWRPLQGAFNALDFGLPAGAATDDPGPPYLMPAVPGRAQTLSVYLRGSAAVNARIFVVPVDETNTQVGAGTEASSATAALPAGANVWGRYAATITAPAGTCFLRGLVELPSGNSDVDVQVTGIQCELGSAATALAPGSGMYLPGWETVRELESTVAVNPGERYVAWDHEAPPARPVLYRARTVSGTLASAPCRPVAGYLDAPARNLLKDPFEPENAVIVNIEARWSESRGRTQQSWQPLGRDAAALGVADPVVKRDWLGGQDGAYTLTALSEEGLARLRYLLSSPRPLLLQFAEGGQRYVIAMGDDSTQRITFGTFGVAVKTVEVGRPA